MNGYKTLATVLIIIFLGHVIYDIMKADNLMMWAVSYGPERAFELILTVVVVSLCKHKAERKPE